MITTTDQERDKQEEEEDEKPPLNHLLLNFNLNRHGIALPHPPTHATDPPTNSLCDLVSLSISIITSIKHDWMHNNQRNVFADKLNELNANASEAEINMSKRKVSLVFPCH